LTAAGPVIAAVEEIKDEEEVSRLIDFPSMYNASRSEIALDLVCTFPSGQEESIVWRKYAPEASDVHRLGCAREAAKRALKPEARYKGFGTTTAEAIRKCKNARGHGFLVRHAPEEGIHHAVVEYMPVDGVPMQKGDKTELKLSLGKMFSNVSQHTCPEPPASS
jgi:hypothetical protein